MTPKPKPREMTAAELDAAFERIRKAIDKIIEREKAKK